MSPLYGPSPDRNSKNWGLIHNNLLGRSLSGKAILHQLRMIGTAIPAIGMCYSEPFPTPGSVGWCLPQG
jgi:hypothetical protein